MDERVLTPEASDAEGEVLDGAGGGLPVHEVAVHESVLQQGGDGVDVVLAHLADVLEEEGQRLEHAVLHVELRHAVLVHERGEHGEGRARLRHDGDGHRCAHAVLPLLHLQVVQQRRQHVLRADSLGDIAEGVDGGTADALLVRLEQLQQLEADPHPLPRRHKLRPAVGDPPHQVDAVLLHLLVPVLEDGCETRQQVLDGRRHLGHADDVDDRLEGPEDGP
mmetsp:Transcript_9934/g.17038  ORF Transcript_9934/g.17038 Transcript_9934/m.17038 type:complete len:221 (-) Transcript_9934:402-1064(-)